MEFFVNLEEEFIQGILRKGEEVFFFGYWILWFFGGGGGDIGSLG